MTEDHRLEVMLNSVRASKAPDEHLRKNDKRMGWLNTPEEAELVDRACAIRDISRNAFLRRAAVAMAAYITGEDYYEAMADAPAVRTYYRHERIGLGGTIFNQHRVIDGSEGGMGQGEWRIKQLG